MYYAKFLLFLILLSGTSQAALAAGALVKAFTIPSQVENESGATN
jgi:hypothetical protein